MLKLTGTAAVTGVAAAMFTILASGSAYAGADEAHMWSFMTNAPSTSAAVPGTNSSGAKATYQGDGFTVLRHDSHQYMDCVSSRGGHLTCKRM